MDLLVFAVCWSLGIFFWIFNRNGFKNPMTRFIPRPMRHTWISGLCMIVIIALICLPGWVSGFPVISTMVFLVLLYIFRRRGPCLLLDDLKLHRMDGRDLFEHSEDCYMDGGGTATFFKKRRERLQKNPKELFR
jgi:hypothetical protein